MESTTKQSDGSAVLMESGSAKPLSVASWLVRILSVGVCSVLLAAILVPPQWAIKNRPWYDYLFPAALWGSMLIIAIWPGVLMRLRSDRLFVAVILILFLVSRLAWVLLVPTEPFSDFAEYNKWASIFGQFQPIHGDMYRLSVNLSQQPWLYPIGLGVLYDIFGHHLMVAKLMNVVVGIPSIFLVHMLARQLFDSTVARLAAVLVLLWPSQLMFTSVLASEHLALVLGLGAFVFFIPAFRDQKRNYRNVIMAGLFLALSFATRYAVIVALPSFILALALTRRSFRWKASHASLLVAAFLITFSLYVGFVALIWRQVPLPNGGIHLLMGTNMSSGGTHIDSDGIAYTSHATITEANQFARAEAFRRIRSNPSGFIRLMADKIVVYWKDDFDGAFFSTEHMYQGKAIPYLTRNRLSLAAVSQFFHLSVLILAFFGCLMLVLQGGDSRLIMILAFILGGTFLASIVVVQARYHYPSEPLIIILAAFGVVSLSSVPIPRWARFVSLKSLAPRLAAFHARPHPAAVIDGSSNSEIPSPPSNRFSWRYIAPLVIAGSALLLISITVLNGRLRTNRQPAGAAPMVQPATAAETKATIIASPNPVKVCDGSGLGITTVAYTFPMGNTVEVHVESPDGTLFARPAVQGSSTTGKWVSDGMVFYLQDVTNGKLPAQENTVATVTVKVTTDGCQ